MGTVPNPRSWVDGETVTKALLDQEIAGSINWVLGRGSTSTVRPMCFAYTTSGVSTSTGNMSYITMQATVFDNDGMRPAQNSAINCQTSGTYIIVARTCWSSNATGRRWTTFWKNGSEPAPAPSVSYPPSTGNVYMPPLVYPVALVQGDVLNLMGQQDSGASLSTLAGSFMGAFWWSL